MSAFFSIHLACVMVLFWTWSLNLGSYELTLSWTFSETDEDLILRLNVSHSGHFLSSNIDTKNSYQFWKKRLTMLSQFLPILAGHRYLKVPLICLTTSIFVFTIVAMAQWILFFSVFAGSVRGITNTFKHGALFLQLALVSTLNRHENGTFKKGPSALKNLQTRNFRFRVHAISLTDFSPNTNPKLPLVAAIL